MVVVGGGVNNEIMKPLTSENGNNAVTSGEREREIYR